MDRKNRPITQTNPEPTLLSWGGWPREKIPHPTPSTGPLSDLQYRQVRLDLGFIVRMRVRMRARQAPLPQITADCHRLLPAIIVAWEISRGYGDKDIRLWLFRPWPSKYLNQ